MSRVCTTTQIKTPFNTTWEWRTYFGTFISLVTDQNVEVATVKNYTNDNLVLYCARVFTDKEEEPTSDSFEQLSVIFEHKSLEVVLDRAAEAAFICHAKRLEYAVNKVKKYIDELASYAGNPVNETIQRTIFESVTNAACSGYYEAGILWIDPRAFKAAIESRGYKVQPSMYPAETIISWEQPRTAVECHAWLPTAEQTKERAEYCRNRKSRILK